MRPLQGIRTPERDMPFENQSVAWNVTQKLSTLQARV